MPNSSKLIENDSFLTPYAGILDRRIHLSESTEAKLTGGSQKLCDWASGHTWFGLHKEGKEWVAREWAPNAVHIEFISEANNWKADGNWFFRKDDSSGVWELRIPESALKHGQLYKLRVCWNGGEGERIPAYAKRAVQDENTKIFSAQVWEPEEKYIWKHPFTRTSEAPRVYEAHAGMAQIEGKVGSWQEFKKFTLPRIHKAGYNTIQLMAVQEHPYYGSFGYHVSNFFAATSRCGTPEELKSLVDEAHSLGIAVIMDIVHSHAVKNETEGLGRFDGSEWQYFHGGERGSHIAWDSRCFDYGKTEVLHFLLSNLRWWLDEYHFDGFRFDGVTSMLYYDHGLGKSFTSYDDYFSGNVDDDAWAYLRLANKVIHQVRPDALSIAEDMSGMPALGTPVEDGGVGFDYRLAMGTPDYWIKLIKEVADENWNMGNLYYELTNRRRDEKSINYAESHDQALVGDQTLIFRLIERDMYDAMNCASQNLRVDRGMALHKMIRLITLATAGHGWLNFMGNEFGHPEWIDFPREGNGWSYHYARRQWHLRDDKELRYRFLGDFDQALMEMCRDNRLLNIPGPYPLHEHISDQVLAFHRADLIFIFNFHPAKSYTDYALNALAGKWKIILDTDSSEFGGFARVNAKTEFFSREEFGRQVLQLYLPARSAMVLGKSK